MRTIRNGSVQINGRIYYVDECHLAYDGRLDGLRYVFGTYSDTHDYVNLWGNEAEWNACRKDATLQEQEDFVSGKLTGPESIDGKLPWMFWRSIDQKVNYGYSR